MQEHRTGERKKERSIKHHVEMLMLSLLKNLFGREPIRVRTRRGFPKEPGRDKNTPLRKGMVQENFWIRGQRSPNGTRKQERSPSGARAEPERSRGLRKEHGTPKGRSGSRNYIIPRPQNLPSFLGDSMLLKPIRLLLVCLSIWGPVRSLYARPTPSRGLRRSCLIIR